MYVKTRIEVQAVIFDKKDGRIVVLLVSKMDRRNRNHRWRLLKGGVNQGETRIQALEREIFEETGLKGVKIIREAYSYDFFFGDTRHKVTSYIVMADSRSPIRLQRSELAAYQWVDKDEASRLLHWRNEREAVRSLDELLNGFRAYGNKDM